MTQASKTTTKLAEEYATPIFDHLTANDDALFIPLLNHAHSQSDISPVINLVRNEENFPYAIAHPLTGIICLLAVAESAYWVPIDRVAHSESCSSCAPIWRALKKRIRTLELGETFYAAATTHSPMGETRILIDAEDLEN